VGGALLAKYYHSTELTSNETETLKFPVGNGLNWPLHAPLVYSYALIRRALARDKLLKYELFEVPQG
jgi:hypothetical protein